MDDQTCGSNSWYLKREVDFHLEHGNLTSLEMPMPLTRRSSLKSQEKMEDLLEAIAVQYGASVVKREIWDKYVVSKYENLTPANLRSWINDQITTITKSYSYLLESLICNMAYYNAVIGEKEVISCACETKDCCDSDDDYCSSDDGYDYTELSLSTRSLEKRAGPRPFDITFSDGRTMHYTSLGVCPLSFPVSLVSPPSPDPLVFEALLTACRAKLQYWSRGQVPVNHPLMQLGFDFVDQNDCLLPGVTPTALTTTTRRRFAGTFPGSTLMSSPTIKTKCRVRWWWRWRIY